MKFLNHHCILEVGNKQFACSDGIEKVVEYRANCEAEHKSWKMNC